MNEKVTAYIIFYNNEDTIKDSISSLLNQTVHINQIILIDDGSSDNSYNEAASFNLPIIRNRSNLGRGFSRAIAHEHSKSDFVLSLDATNILPRNFIENTLHWFKDENVGAVYGRICQREKNTLSEKWRSIHLFKDHIKQEIKVNDTFISYGSIIRGNAYKQVNGYNKNLRFNEDNDLGKKFKKTNYDVIFDPKLEVFSISKEGIFKTLERYSRWYSGYGNIPNLKNYFKNIIYSINYMIKEDFHNKYYCCIFISLICPHFHFIYQYYLFGKKSLWK
jgi:biofilm PGA synthesis N-glycosyltransferase PgaC